VFYTGDPLEVGKYGGTAESRKFTSRRTSLVPLIVNKEAFEVLKVRPRISQSQHQLKASVPDGPTDGTATSLATVAVERRRS
jgi:hypothetical protein